MKPFLTRCALFYNKAVCFPEYRTYSLSVIAFTSSYGRPAKAAIFSNDKVPTATFEDGAHIMYVNGEYRDDTPLGRLMLDFSRTDPNDMNYQVLYFKKVLYMSIIKLFYLFNKYLH